MGVDLRRGGERLIGWMQSSELQRRAAGNPDCLARLRGKDMEGWSVDGQNRVCSGGSAVPRHGLRGVVVGRYLPVLVVDEEQLKKERARVVVMMKRVAVGRTARGVGHGNSISSWTSPR